MKISVKIAEILIAAGCDPTLRTNEGKTPTMLAIEQVFVLLLSNNKFTSRNLKKIVAT